MRAILTILGYLFVIHTYGQQDSTLVYKKRVLESTEVDILSSYYTQEGSNASVTGGVGSEELTDITPTLVVTMPMNADDVLTIDFGISTYTSASSSNLDPLDFTETGSPWIASSGASSGDTRGSLLLDYSRSSDDRNTLWSVHGSGSVETVYTSIGFGGGYTRMFNQKNTELGLKMNIFLDTWRTRYPYELESYVITEGDITEGFFINLNVFDQDGNITQDWTPIDGFELIQNKRRNSFALSINLNQILNHKTQFSIFADLILQTGLLSNAMHRIYFQDIDNYYVGEPSSIDIYTSPENTDVFQLADDIERLPDSRFKLPMGMRFHYYLNELLTLRMYYRYYWDDWGIQAHTANLEIPFKISQKFTIFPSYRFYSQTAASYFAPYERHLSTQTYYTSDYDLSKFHANQFGLGISYVDVLENLKVWKFGLKGIDLRYHHYERNTGLSANIIALAFKFVQN